MINFFFLGVKIRLLNYDYDEHILHFESRWLVIVPL